MLDEQPSVFERARAEAERRNPFVDACSAWLFHGDLPIEDPERIFKTFVETVGADEDADGRLLSIAVREPFVDKFGFVVPHRRLIQCLMDHGPILKIGAGAGTLALAVGLSGGDIIATDIKPWFGSGHLPDLVARQDGETAVRANPGRSVLLSWPTLHDPWPAKALDAMTPRQTLLMIGEGPGGCTGCPELWACLDQEFERTPVRDDPLWCFPHVHDCLQVYRRHDAESSL